MSPAIDGPRLSPQNGKPKQLVVFLHGFGADGHDLIELGRQWRSFLPNALFVAPNAPDRCAASPTGRQWFALNAHGSDPERDASERWNGVQNASAGLNDFLDKELDQAGLDDAQLALVGFSQGAMMALHLGLRRARAPAAILAYSGLLAGPEYLSQAIARDTRGLPPPILLVHGDQDAVISIDAMFSAANALAEGGIPAQWHVSLGAGHGIDSVGLRHGGLFLAKALGAIAR